MMDMHNHTTWSHDAYNSPEEIVENAISRQICILGISDHHRSVLNGHEDIDNFKNYILHINNLKDKYKEKINIFTGIELNVNFYSDEAKEFPYSVLQDLDFILLEHVDGTGLFAQLQKDCVKLTEIGQILERLGNHKLVGLAHTNLLYLAHKYSERKGIEYGINKVVSILAENKLFWEINIQHNYEYFDQLRENKDKPETQYLFKKLKEYNVKVSAASDTHNIRYTDYNRLKLANDLAYDINPLFSK